MTRCGIGFSGAQFYAYEHLSPGLYVWSNFNELPCLSWAPGAPSCLISRGYISLAPTWPLDGTHTFSLDVIGEPCPDRLFPAYREKFNFPAHAVNRADVDWSGTVNQSDIQSIFAWVISNDPRGDWNANGETTPADLTEYLSVCWPVNDEITEPCP